MMIFQNYILRGLQFLIFFNNNVSIGIKFYIIKLFVRNINNIKFNLDKLLYI